MDRSLARNLPTGKSMADGSQHHHNNSNNDNNNSSDNYGDSTAKSVLVWHKLETEGGYQPALREGHSSVSYGSNVLVFGGYETGRVSGWITPNSPSLLPVSSIYTPICSLQLIMF